MTIFLLSLGGFPPTAGFIAKWYVFSAAIGAGYYGLAIIGVLSSVVSVFFYLRIVVMMYMSERDARPVPPPVSGLALAGLVASVVGGAGARRAAGPGDRLGRAVDCDDFLDRPIACGVIAAGAGRFSGAERGASTAPSAYSGRAPRRQPPGALAPAGRVRRRGSAPQTGRPPDSRRRAAAVARRAPGDAAGCRPHRPSRRRAAPAGGGSCRSARKSSSHSQFTTVAAAGTSASRWRASRSALSSSADKRRDAW